MAAAVAAVAAVAERKSTRKAQRDELPRITGEGMRQMIAGGPVRRCFFVASRTTPGLEYPVYVLADGGLSCPCVGAYYRGTCAHRRVVLQRLEEEAAAIQRAEAQAEEEAERGWVLTAKGRRALERERERAARETEASPSPMTNPATYTSAERPRRRMPSGAGACDLAPTNPPSERAMMRRSQEPFHLLK